MLLFADNFNFCLCYAALVDAIRLTLHLLTAPSMLYAGLNVCSGEFYWCNLSLLKCNAKRRNRVKRTQFRLSPQINNSLRLKKKNT